MSFLLREREREEEEEEEEEKEEKDDLCPVIHKSTTTQNKPFFSAKAVSLDSCVYTTHTKNINVL